VAEQLLGIVSAPRDDTHISEARDETASYESSTNCLPRPQRVQSIFGRKDTITMGAGDAVASNEAIQTADPWPRYSQNNNIPMDGVKAQRAIQRYRSNGENGPPPGGGAAASNGGAPN
jgi:hypothetical protein